MAGDKSRMVSFTFRSKRWTLKMRRNSVTTFVIFVSSVWIDYCNSMYVSLIAPKRGAGGPNLFLP